MVMNDDDVPNSSPLLGMIASDTVGFDQALQSRQFNDRPASELHSGQLAKSDPSPDRPVRNAEQPRSLSHSNCKWFVHRITPDLD